MKRKNILSVIIVVYIMATLFCGCKNDEKHNCSENLISSENSTTENKATETLSEKYIREIETAYLEEKESVYVSLSTVDKCLLIEKYTNRWKQVADEKYNELMKYDGILQPSEVYYSSEDFCNSIYNMKLNWDEYCKTETANYIITIQSIYNSGTICGPLLAEYEYEMQKQWALKLVGIYEQLNI